MSRRTFWFWCENCRTVVTVETAEDGIDDSRNVDAMPNSPTCPMCEGQTYDYDWLAGMEETELSDPSWGAFERWFSKDDKGRLVPPDRWWDEQCSTCNKPRIVEPGEHNFCSAPHVSRATLGGEPVLIIAESQTTYTVTPAGERSVSLGGRWLYPGDTADIPKLKPDLREQR